MIWARAVVCPPQQVIARLVTCQVLPGRIHVSRDRMLEYLCSKMRKGPSQVTIDDGNVADKSKILEHAGSVSGSERSNCVLSICTREIPADLQGADKKSRFDRGYRSFVR